jgi:hypothetical protein
MGIQSRLCDSHGMETFYVKPSKRHKLLFIHSCEISLYVDLSQETSLVLYLLLYLDLIHLHLFMECRNKGA